MFFVSCSHPTGQTANISTTSKGFTTVRKNRTGNPKHPNTQARKKTKNTNSEIVCLMLGFELELELESNSFPFTFLAGSLYYPLRTNETALVSPKNENREVIFEYAPFYRIS